MQRGSHYTPEKALELSKTTGPKTRPNRPFGAKLASGVYFVKVWSQYDGQEVKSITILK